LNRRSKLGLPLENQANVRSSPTIEIKQEKVWLKSILFNIGFSSDIQFCFQLHFELKLLSNIYTFQWNYYMQISKPVYTTTKIEHLRECLRSLKREHKVKHDNNEKPHLKITLGMVVFVYLIII
jgi:dolichol kinase